MLKNLKKNDLVAYYEPTGEVAFVILVDGIDYRGHEFSGTVIARHKTLGSLDAIGDRATYFDLNCQNYKIIPNKVLLQKLRNV